MYWKTYIYVLDQHCHTIVIKGKVRGKNICYSHLMIKLRSFKKFT